MKQNLLTTAAAAALLAISCGSFASDKDVVKYRENAMEVIGGHMGSIVAIVKKEVPHKEHMQTHADGLAAAAKLVKDSFKEKAMTKDSDALPKIWEDWDGFVKAADQMETAAADFAAAVKGGNPALIGKNLGALGDSCKNCHDNFTDD